jgi:hypothetical protein
MVNNGIKTQGKTHKMGSSAKPGKMTFRGDGLGRIQLPTDLTSQISWLQERTESIQAWLFLVSDGGFRLLSTQEVESDEILKSIRAIIVQERTTERAEPSSTDTSDLAPLAAKLFPITLQQTRQSSWRFSVPPLMDIFAPPYSNQNDFVAVLSHEGYWEIWYTEAFKRAALGPVPASLRSRRE